MEGGALTDGTDDLLGQLGLAVPGHGPDDGGEVATLRHDVQCVLLQYTRDRPSAPMPRLTEAQAAEMAAGLAPLLARRIGGRYVPKGAGGSAERAERDRAVWQAFTGRNHREVMVQFGISRRLLYSILSRRRRG